MEGNSFQTRLNTKFYHFIFNRINLDFDIMFQSFANVHVALFIWLLMKLSTAILVFTGFYLWSKNRENYSKNISKY